MGDLKKDAVVVGGGMAGLLTAARLRQAGLDTAVIERESIASGVTAGTTAKITSQHGLIYDKLIRRFGHERARQYAHANQRAIDRFWEMAAEIGAQCAMQEMDAYVYSTSGGTKTQREAAAAQSLGIPASLVVKTDLPFPVTNAVRFAKQAQFHPLQFLAALVQDMEIYEHTMATAIGPGEVLTPGGVIHAKAVVLATHFPIVNVPGFFFFRMHQSAPTCWRLKTPRLSAGCILARRKTASPSATRRASYSLAGREHARAKIERAAILSS